MTLPGSAISTSTAEGMAPINGPNTGMMFVMPMIIEIIITYGILNISMQTAHMQPIIKESIIFPYIKLKRAVFVEEVMVKIL